MVIRMHKPKIRRDFLKLLQISFKHYFEILKASWLFILLFVMAKDLSSVFYHYWSSGFHFSADSPYPFYIAWATEAVVGFLLIFLWACSLRAADDFLSGHDISLKKIFHRILTIFPRIFFAVLAFFAIFEIFMLFSHAVAGNSVIFLFILFLMPVMFLYVLFFFAIPIIIIHKSQVLRAFRSSGELVGFQNWFHSFGLYALTLFCVFLIYPGTLHQHVLANYYLNVPFDIVVLGIFFPLLNAMIVLSENDFKIS